MNPFTQQLLAGIEAPTILAFAKQWDGLEVLILRVFRQKHATPSDEKEYKLLQSQIKSSYHLLTPLLTPYWQQTLMRGPSKSKQNTPHDPFLALLSAPSASEFAHNRQAFVTLPPAREALNSFLLAQKESRS